MYFMRGVVLLIVAIVSFDDFGQDIMQTTHLDRLQDFHGELESLIVEDEEVDLGQPSNAIGT